MTKIMSNSEDHSEMEIFSPIWAMNDNNHGYSIDSLTPLGQCCVTAIRESKKDTVHVLEIGPGNNQSFAKSFLETENIQITFIDPGSEFENFPQNDRFTFIQGFFPQDLSDNHKKKFDYVYSSRVLHCNNPENMKKTMEEVSELLKDDGMFYLETTSIKSGYYLPLEWYFQERQHLSFPGHITEEVFLKYIDATFKCGDVTLLAMPQLETMMQEAGMNVKEKFEYKMKSVHSEFDIILCVECEKAKS